MTTPSASYSFREINLRGCKQHSSGKLKFPSSQTDAHPASVSQAALMLRAAVATDAIIAFSDLKVPRRWSRHSAGKLLTLNLTSPRVALSREEGRVTDVGASPRGCPVFRVGADRRVCPDDSAGAAACRAGLLRVGREAARERDVGAAARNILGRHIGLPLRRE